MILVDSSIWIDHIHHPDVMLAEFLGAGKILMHPFIVGEIALGTIRNRGSVLRSLRKLPTVAVARDEEVLRLVDAVTLFGVGIGWVDAHLLAACRLSAGARLWTRDRRLLASADRLALSAIPLH